MKDNLFALSSVAFPGGYKFFIIIIITLFSGEGFANEFSNYFFWVTLLVTFSGLPLASAMVSSQHQITDVYKVFIIVMSSVIAYSVSYTIALNQFDASVNIAVFLSLVAQSFYEVYKRYFLNTGDFVKVFIASLFTVIFFLVSYFLFGYSTSYMLFLSFFSLLFPMLIAYLFREVKKGDENLSKDRLLSIIQIFFKYLVSNATSTSLMYFLPIVIIHELGNNVAASLAQVFYLSTLSYFLPRALSAKHIPIMRSEGIYRGKVKSFYSMIFVFVVGTSIVALLAFSLLYEQWMIFFLLYLSMNASQLALPYANVLMVKGEATLIMSTNLKSTIALLLVVALIFTCFEQGEERCMLLLIAFTLYQILKLSLTRYCSRQFFLNN
ncbi:hypothetical protein [Vibrio owensii]|uniref:hypothetical protein n=1 Tax=Vibrio owensii TaxID=696485 RepID=UPI0018F1C31E|nr:hypothetical protein [Vibrio owensii]